MKRYITLLLICLGCITTAMAGHFKNFRTTAYVMVQDVNRHKNADDWEKDWKNFSPNLKLDKVYLETFRDQTFVDDKAMDIAIKFFKKKGVEVQGGITYNYSGGGRQRWDSFCYSNPEMLDIIQKIAEKTAALFDEIVLDDYYFTNCKCDLCIDAKGDKSWGEFRCDLLDKVARERIVGPAKKVNPKCKVIVKYPNWYDHFHGLGFDLARGPYTFDGVYTGTETRNPRGEQHLQAYESFGIIKYFENLRPEHNFGGWVDTGDLAYDEMFAEQLWMTLLAKAPEITIFNYNTINYEKWAKIAQQSYETVDKVLGRLGKPKGIKAYKPSNSEGEDFLHNYMGMIGVPVEIVPQFPEDENIVILTECCKYDPEILDKMKRFMRNGKDVVVTSGFYRAMQDKGIKDIFEMTATSRSADIDTIATSRGWWKIFVPTEVPIRIPCFMYHTNDSWELLTGMQYDNGWPLLHHSIYSKGNMFVWVIPDNFSHLYALPSEALAKIRGIVSKDMQVQIDGPSRVSLHTYDNGTFAVHNFRNTEVEVSLIVRNAKGVTDLMTEENLVGEIHKSERLVGRPVEDVALIKVKIAPHTFRAFEANK